MVSRLFAPKRLSPHYFPGELAWEGMLKGFMESEAAGSAGSPNTKQPALLPERCLVSGAADSAGRDRYGRTPDTQHYRVRCPGAECRWIEYA
jgi:hypothetical protein